MCLRNLFRCSSLLAMFVPLVGISLCIFDYFISVDGLVLRQLILSHKVSMVSLGIHQSAASFPISIAYGVTSAFAGRSSRFINIGGGGVLV